MALITDIIIQQFENEYKPIFTANNEWYSGCNKNFDV